MRIFRQKQPVGTVTSGPSDGCVGPVKKGLVPDRAVTQVKRLSLVMIVNRRATVSYWLEGKRPVMFALQAAGLSDVTHAELMLKEDLLSWRM